MSDDDRRDIIDALMAHAHDFAQLHHGHIRMDANAAGLVADIVMGYVNDVHAERDRLRAAVEAGDAVDQAYAEQVEDLHAELNQVRDRWALAIAERDAAETERDRLRDQLSRERRLNAESGCPDCGVHHGCALVVAERDRLRAVIEKIHHGLYVDTAPEPLDDEGISFLPGVVGGLAESLVRITGERKEGT